MRRFWAALLALGLSRGLLYSAEESKPFPEFDAGGLTVYGSWLKSSLVVVGEVTNGKAYGVEWKDRLPWPNQGGIHKLYWCRGRLQVTAVIRGEAPPALEVYWASGRPGCRIDFSDRRQFREGLTKVWFIKQDGGFQAVLYAYGYRRYLELPFTWESRSGLAPRDRLGTLLLTPRNDPQALLEFGERIWDRGDLACELVGKESCTRLLRGLAQRGREAPGGEALTEAACRFLKAEQGVACEPE